MESPVNKMITHWIFQTVAMLLTAALLPRMYVTSILGAFFVVLALAFVNATIWDAALFFSVPNSVTTHAVLLLFANGVLFWALTKLLPGIQIEGFWPAIVAPVIFTVLSVIIDRYGRQIDWPYVLDQMLDMTGRARDYFRAEGRPAVNH